jgi:hypothetical protein
MYVPTLVPRSVGVCTVKLPIRKFLYQGLAIPLLIPGHFPATHSSFLHSPMPENSSGPRCRKSLPVPGMIHFTYLHAIKFWPMEGDLAWLQGPEFSGMGECKRSHSRDRKSFPASGNAKDLLPGTWSVRKTFPALAREKKLQQGHHAANIMHYTLCIMQQTTIELTTAETLASACVPPTAKRRP